MAKKTWKSLRESRLSPEGQARVRARIAQELEELTLKALRQRRELTQTEVGRAADMTQSELSRLESRNDHLTSTLRRFVEALGGELEVTAVFGDQRVKITDA
jgi:predicted transcriptional regulator